MKNKELFKEVGRIMFKPWKPFIIHNKLVDIMALFKAHPDDEELIMKYFKIWIFINNIPLFLSSISLACSIILLFRYLNGSI